jgi:transcriptional regulator with XRE-family HTH domain
MVTETGEETIQRILSGYELGAKLRTLRLRKKISLVDLGKHTGLSASMLSQLENGKLVPTLPTLARIAMVFDVGMDYFFSDKKRRKLFSVVRAAERMRFPDRAGNPNPNYFFEVLAYSAQEKGLHAYVADFPQKSTAVEEHYHDGAELVFLLEGKLAIGYQGEEHVLGTGDSVYFDSSEPHTYRGVEECKALVVTTPPRI